MKLVTGTLFKEKLLILLKHNIKNLFVKCHLCSEYIKFNVSKDNRCTVTKHLVKYSGKDNRRVNYIDGSSCRSGSNFTICSRIIKYYKSFKHMLVSQELGRVGIESEYFSNIPSNLMNQEKDTLNVDYSSC